LRFPNVDHRGNFVHFDPRLPALHQRHLNKVKNKIIKTVAEKMKSINAALFAMIRCHDLQHQKPLKLVAVGPSKQKKMRVEVNRELANLSAENRSRI